MEKHPCKVKLHQNKIVCASEILCDDCPERNKCQDMVINLDDKYGGL